MAIDPATVAEIYRAHPDAMQRVVNLLTREVTLRWDDLTFAAGSITVNPVGAVANPARDEVEADFPGTLLYDWAEGTAINGTARLIELDVHYLKDSRGSPEEFTK